MEQTKALNALEPFLALCKSATSSRAAADLVTRATSAPNTFIFAELLETPQIQALSGDSELSKYLETLRIFSYGTYQQYQSTSGLPPLNDEQTLKLRQLSLLTLARDRSNLSYDSLQKALGLSSNRELEDLVISAVYAGLLTATLDPSRQAVQVSSVSPLRDLSPGSIPNMIAMLRNWAERCSDTLDELEAETQRIRATASVREKEKRIAQEKQQQLINEAKESEKKKSPLEEALTRRFNKRTMPEAGREMAAESMEVDEPRTLDAEEKRASKRKM